MTQKSLLFVANWKMELSINQSINYCQDNLEGFIDLGRSLGHKIVLCPTLPALGFIMVVIENTPIILGAQNCSEFASGPYTGQVSASSLAELGCQYCIIGHSEQRRYCHQTDETVARKARMLLMAGINPIICIGEAEPSSDIASIVNIIDKQLVTLRDYILDVEPLENTIIFAYEPWWAIGTGTVPSLEHLHKTFNQLDQLSSKILPSSIKYQFLYGGGVTEETIGQLTHIQELSGFLIGGASRDFQKFKKLVSLCC